MPTLTRVRESTENIPSSRRVRDVSRDIAYLDAGEAPFVLLTQRAGKRTVYNPKFEFIEKEQAPRLSTINGAQTNVDTAIEVAAGTGQYFYPNDVVQNLRTKEMFRVTAVATDTLTVVRGVGTVAGAAMNNLDSVLILGPVASEGGARGQERAVQESYPFNYTQIFKTDYGSTGTQTVSENYVGNERTWLQKQNAIEHVKAIEFFFLYGQRNIDIGDTGKPIRYTGGFTHFVTSNLQDFGGVATEPEWETFMQTVFQYTGGSSSRILFAAPGVVSSLDQTGWARTMLPPSNKTLNMEVTQVASSHGTLNVVKHRLLMNGADGQGYGGQAFAVDIKKVNYIALRQRDTRLFENVGDPGDDAWTDEYRTECGFEIRNEKIHGIATNVLA